MTTEPARRGRGRPPHPDILTPREWQVLDLIREGLTNEQIAQRLDVSLATAKYHVSEILTKLGLTSREEAAAWQPEPVPIRWWQRALASVPRRAWPLVGVAAALTALAALGVIAWSLSDRDEEQQAVGAPTPSEASLPSATPLTTAPSTPTLVPLLPPPGAPQLVYIHPDGGLWVASPDGAYNRRLTDRCPGNQIKWSPDGEFLACSYFSMAIFNAEGHEVWRRDHSIDAPGIMFLEWAPDSRRLAFRDADGAIHIVHVADGTDQIVKSDALPLGWVGGNTLLVGLNVQDSEGPSAYTYETHLLNIETGESTSAPYFDGKRFWVSPGGDRVVVLTGTGSEDVGLAVYDVATGIETPVQSVGISYPSEGIPNRSISFSKDGTKFFAASAQSAGPTTIFTCAIEASGCEVFGSVPGVLLTISDEGFVAYLTPGGIPETLHIADLATGATATLGLAHPNFAWRPTRQQ